MNRQIECSTKKIQGQDHTSKVINDNKIQAMLFTLFNGTRYECEDVYS